MRSRFRCPWTQKSTPGFQLISLSLGSNFGQSRGVIPGYIAELPTVAVGNSPFSIPKRKMRYLRGFRET